MALIACAECKREISSEAFACPHCGKPQEGATLAAQADQEQRRKDSKDAGQRTGCAFMVIGAVACIFSLPIGVAILFVGLLMAALNTRLK